MVREAALYAIEDALADIKVDEARRKLEVAVIEKFVKKRLVVEMKACSELFAALFREVSHVGSSYDNLRLDGAGDFDLNFVLDIDVLINNNAVRLDFGVATAGFVNLVVGSRWMTSIQSNHGLYHLRQELCDDLMASRHRGEYTFDAGKINRWMESLVQRAINRVPDWELDAEYDIKSMVLSRSGPAKTLTIKTVTDIAVVVDLVPVFDFPLRLLQCHPIIGWKIGTATGKFYVVPKSSTSWKISLAMFEKKYVPGFIKPLIRLLKKFRDANPPLNSHMSSYSLKTVVMHLKDDVGDSSEIWKLNRMHDLFLEALSKMEDYMDPVNLDGLPNYWDESNEWYGMNRRERLNKYNWLTRVISELRINIDNREVWAKRFRRTAVASAVEQVDDVEDEEFIGRFGRANISTSMVRGQEEEEEEEDPRPTAGEMVVLGLGLALGTWMRSSLNR